MQNVADIPTEWATLPYQQLSYEQEGMSKVLAGHGSGQYSRQGDWLN